MELEEAFEAIFGNAEGRNLVTKKLNEKQSNVNNFFKDFAKNSGYESQDDIAGLKSTLTKKKEEIEKLKKEREELEETHKIALSKNSDEVVTGLQKQLEEAEDRNKELQNSFNTVREKTALEFQDQIKDLENKNNTLIQRQEDALITENVLSVFNKIGVVDKSMQEALLALDKSKHKFSVERDSDGSNRVFITPVGGVRMPVADHYELEAKNKEGAYKPFISKLENTTTPSYRPSGANKGDSEVLDDFE